MLLVEIALIVLIVQIVARPILMAYWFTRPPRLRVAFRTPADWGASYQDVEFPGGEGITLRGWYLPPQNGAVVILLHGHSGNRLAMGYHAERLTAAGFGVLMFDLRAHGDSGGRRFSRGVEAIDDVLGAVTFVARQGDAPGRIGVMGVSVGGMLALQAAARSASVRAVAADGPILGTVDDLPPPRGPFDRYWRYPLERYYQKGIDWFSRSDRPPPNTVALARLGWRPVLFISTGVGLEQRLTRLLYDAAHEPKRLWEIPHASHATGWAVEPEAYGRELVDFFTRSLAVAPNGDEEAEEADRRPTTDERPQTIDDRTWAAREQMPPVEPMPVAERTVSPPTAMMVAFSVIPAAMLLLLLPYQLRWGFSVPRLPAGREVAALLGLVVLLAGGLWLHEVIHWAAYRLFGRVPRGAARLRFTRAPLAPQVHCDAPVSAAAYRRMLLSPALALGLLPGAAAVLLGSWVLLIWAIWMLVAAGGDFATLWAMRGLAGDAPVRAHPRRVGCEVFAEE
jgi:fermentation-respiration switch protein FrsA (DUF1100 family)